MGIENMPNPTPKPSREQIQEEFEKDFELAENMDNNEYASYVDEMAIIVENIDNPNALIENLNKRKDELEAFLSKNIDNMTAEKTQEAKALLSRVNASAYNLIGSNAITDGEKTRLLNKLKSFEDAIKRTYH